MPYTTAAKNSMLSSLVGKTAPVVIDALSLHATDPGSTGTGEVAGGGYARVAVTEADFNSATNGEITTDNDKTFSGPANQAVGFYGAWDSGVFVGGGALTGDATFNAAGQYILKTGTKLDLNG